MTKREDIISITLAKYEQPLWGYFWLGKGRRSLALGRYALIFELWFHP